ncbi:MAG: hypothetical protein ACRDTR_16835 [Rubrobacter sp.]
MRDGYVIRDLIDRAIWDEHFRFKARFDLEGALREAGFWEDLTDSEKEIAASFQSETSEDSDALLVDKLKTRSLSVGLPDWGP